MDSQVNQYLCIHGYSRMILRRSRVDVQPCLPPAKKPAISAVAEFNKPDSPCHPDHDAHHPNLKMDIAATNLPKPNPDKPQGDDSYFICAHRNTLGVAVGVGGWDRLGIDGGQYARDLMLNASLSACRQPEGPINPRTVLDEAFNDTKSKGTSTACIATLKHDHEHEKHWLHAVNVGDSGFMLFRNNKLLFQSPTQQHKFNTPYQLGNSKKSDKPEKAEEFEVEAMAGDIVVFATDGLFDNLHPREIERYIELNCEGDERATPEELACIIAELAVCNSRNKHAKTPFAEASLKAGKNHRGGKTDDITVLVAYILSDVD